MWRRESGTFFQLLLLTTNMSQSSVKVSLELHLATSATGKVSKYSKIKKNTANMMLIKLHY
jgi:hypothetical protein